MAQFARPDATAAAGGWTDETGLGINPPHTRIDEAAPDDLDFIQSSSGPASDACIVGLSDITDPNTDTGHTVRYRYGKDSSAGQQIDIDVTLLRDTGPGGLDPVASWQHVDVTATIAQADQTLTTTQAGDIADYAVLFVEFRANAVGGGQARRGVVTWQELEVPDPVPTVSGTLQSTAPAAQASAVGTLIVSGTAQTASPAAVASATAQATASGTLHSSAPAATVSLAGAVTVSGELSFTAPSPTASVSVFVGELAPPPPERTLTVPPEDRTLLIQREDRTVTMAGEDRTLTVDPEDRTTVIEAEDRTLVVV